MDIITLGAIAILAVVVLTAFYLFQRVKARGKAGPFEAEIDASNEPNAGIQLEGDSEELRAPLQRTGLAVIEREGAPKVTKAEKQGASRSEKGQLLKILDVSNWTGGDDKKE